MRLLKIILFFFALYLIRRFIQMYRVMKEIQRVQNESQRPPSKGKEAIDADYKVMDP